MTFVDLNSQPAASATLDQQSKLNKFFYFLKYYLIVAL